MTSHSQDGLNLDANGQSAIAIEDYYLIKIQDETKSCLLYIIDVGFSLCVGWNNNWQ